MIEVASVPTARFTENPTPGWKVSSGQTNTFPV